MRSQVFPLVSELRTRTMDESRPLGDRLSRWLHGLRLPCLFASCVCCGILVAAPLRGDEPANPKKAVQDDKAMKRLSPTDEIWVDAVHKRVIVGGTICLREGTLEMFACPVGTKEHESVVAVRSKAYLIHTALLAIGARPGQPAQFEPTYQPPRGASILVEVLWRDTQGEVQRRTAQQMIRSVKTKEPLSSPFVFAGSGFWKDEESGERYYQAEGGELICVSNFSTAMLDLPLESSRDADDLLFEANPEEIPPRGTKVRLILSIVQPDAKPASSK